MPKKNKSKPPVVVVDVVEGKKKKKKRNKSKKNKKTQPRIKGENIPAVKAYNVPTSSFRSWGTSKGEQMMSFRERLGQLTMPMVLGDDGLLFDMMVHPVLMKVGGRLFTIAKNWEKYKFTKFVVEFVPCVPSTINAQVVMSFDPDPDGVITGTDYSSMADAAMTRARSKCFSINEANRLAMNCNPDLGIHDWFVDQYKSDRKFSIQGKFEVHASTPLISAGTITSDLTVGTLWANWTICLKEPQMSPGVGPVTGDTVQQYLNWDFWQPLSLIYNPLLYVTSNSSENFTDKYWWYNNGGNLDSNGLGFHVGNSSSSSATTVELVREMIYGQMYLIQTGWDPAAPPALGAWRDFTFTSGTRVQQLVGRLFLFGLNSYQVCDSRLPPETAITGNRTAYCFGVWFTPLGMRIGNPTNMQTSAEGQTKGVRKAGTTAQGQAARLLLASMKFPVGYSMPRETEMQVRLDELERRISELAPAACASSFDGHWFDQSA